MGQVLDNISQFADEIRADGVEGDKLMRLTDGSAKRLRDSGVIRMFQPKEFGGLEAHPREFAETAMAIGAMDGATGWVSGIVGVHPWELAFFDRKAQEEVWGTDPDTWMASPYAPMGVARPVEGGYILNGRWSFSSGTDHCDWIMIGAMVGDESGKPLMPPKHLHVLLPRSDYDIDQDSWNVVGPARNRVEGPDRQGRVPAHLPHDRRRKGVRRDGVEGSGSYGDVVQVPVLVHFPVGDHLVVDRYRRRCVGVQHGGAA
ncbi:hydroxylase [Rhodococcus erythropolis]|uniref:Hydroxylase n=1 Tax=Rhodococcus erythropolis TaxID=1833 RepID=A0A6G9D0E8_RHOER|nr:hydroxylase [Rhodococcus erythropolis]